MVLPQGMGQVGKTMFRMKIVRALQKNLFRFHGCGVGKNLSPKVCRYAVIMRAMVSLSKGRSAVSMSLLERLRNAD